VTGVVHFAGGPSHTTIGGPQLLKEPLQTYRVLPPHGTVRLVEF